MTTLALNRATFRITQADLEFMVLDKESIETACTLYLGGGDDMSNAA